MLDTSHPHPSTLLFQLRAYTVTQLISPLHHLFTLNLLDVVLLTIPSDMALYSTLCPLHFTLIEFLLFCSTLETRIRGLIKSGKRCVTDVYNVTINWNTLSHPLLSAALFYPLCPLSNRSYFFTCSDAHAQPYETHTTFGEPV